MGTTVSMRECVLGRVLQVLDAALLENGNDTTTGSNDQECQTPAKSSVERDSASAYTLVASSI